MKIWHAGMAATVLLLGAALAVGGAAPSSEQDVQEVNYLYIEEFEFPSGSVVVEGIAEASQWVRDLRATGEFKSVRLYMHHTGPRFALYLFAEPRDWQAIETGFAKFFEARPDIMESPFNWAGHSDNVLSEVPVQ
jgi:hypothetical protein